MIHHADIPRDISDNLVYRDRLTELCAKDKSAQAGAWQMCKDDVLFYVNSFAWTFRPKAGIGQPKVVPFVTWPAQDDVFRGIIDHINRQRELAGEKSRDLGWSWICCYTADWLWRFHDWNKTGLFSRVADLVDSKDPDSLFWKVRFVQKWLPLWLYPRGWVARKHDTSNYLENPQTNSVITGQATTKDMGVAGRCTWAVFDEFARVPNAYEVRDNTKDTSDCRVWVSTHTGPGTCFHQITTNGVTDKIVSHWSGHPKKALGLYKVHPERAPSQRVEILDKTYPFPPDYPFVTDGRPSGGPRPLVRSVWYDEECKGRSEADVRTNLDIDVLGSTKEFFPALLIRQLIGEFARPPIWTGEIVQGQLAPVTNGHLALWVRPDPMGRFATGRYVMGADIAAGTGATPSCLSIVNADLGEKVGEYANPDVRPDQFAVTCAMIGKLFCSRGGQEARFVWEASGSVGRLFTDAFFKLGYYHVYYQETDPGYGGFLKPTDKPGYWMNSNEDKKETLLAYAADLEKRNFVNRSEEALLECLQFRWGKGGTVEHTMDKNAQDGSGARMNHSDRAIADALANFLRAKTGIRRPIDQPSQEPVVGGWQWRNKLHEEEDRLSMVGDD